MKEVLDLLKSMRINKIKIMNMNEVRFRYGNTIYILTIEEDVIKIRMDVIVYTFDRNKDTMSLIRDFLNM